jgi:CheY-like chemotaxis protein
LIGIDDRRRKKMPKSLNLPPLALVIDDDHLAGLLFARALEKLSLQVKISDTRWKAIQLAELHAHRIVLMLVDVVLAPPDLQMQGDFRGRVEDGARLLSLLKYLCPNAIAVQMSAYSPGELAENGYQLVEAQQFLQKPFTGGMLREHIQKLLPDLQMPRNPILPVSDVTWTG